MPEPATAAERPARDWFMLAGLAVAALAAGWVLLSFTVFPDAEAWGYDYGAYVDAAERLAQTGSLYQEETLSGPYRPGPFGLYMYAPPLGVAISPLTRLSLEAGTLFWFILHVAALALACALMPVRFAIRLAAFGVGALSFAVTRDLVLGNVSVLLLLPMVAAWRWLDRPAGSAALALAISVRPTLGIFLVWQLLRRRWRALTWTIGAGLVIILATLPVVGIEGYREYLSVLANMSDVSGVERNVDLGSTALSLGASGTVASLALLAGYGLAIAALLLSLRRDAELGFMVTSGAALLLSPLLWDHYLAALILPAAFLAARGRPVGILLPLLSWLPAELLGVVAVVATISPFWAARPREVIELVRAGAAGTASVALPGLARR